MFFVTFENIITETILRTWISALWETGIRAMCCKLTKWFVLKDVLDKPYENLNKEDTNLKENSTLGTNTLLTGEKIHSVKRLDMQVPQRTDTYENNTTCIVLYVLIDISSTNIRIEIQIIRIYHGHIYTLTKHDRGTTLLYCLRLSVNVKICIILIT
jgi:hypothetical protein